MNRFKNVLVVARGNDAAALERARRLARANGARLTLVDVVDELPTPNRLLMGRSRLADLQAALRLARETDLEGRAAALREEGLEVDVEVRTGKAFVEIVRRVLEHGHDLVVKPAQGEGRVAFGSTGMHLMRKCPCPVWLVQGPSSAPYAGILAAVDPDPDRPEDGDLNRLILDLATSLAAREGSPLHVVHAWRVYGEDTLSHGVHRLPDDELASLLADEEERHRSWLATLLADYRDHSMAVHLVHAPPHRAIPLVARREGVELVVLGSLARTGVAGYFIGNTAERVLTEVDCSVLTVKAEGFVTPVTLDLQEETKLRVAPG